MKIKFLFALLLLIPELCYAVDLQFSWLPNSDSTTGYKIYYGTETGNYTESIDIGNPEPVNGRIIGTVTGIPYGSRYFYAATAYNPAQESGFSNEVEYTAEWPVPGTPSDVKLDITINVNVNVN